jgi:hypothetical protein
MGRLIGSLLVVRGCRLGQQWLGRMWPCSCAILVGHIFARTAHRSFRRVLEALRVSRASIRKKSCAAMAPGVQSPPRAGGPQRTRPWAKRQTLKLAQGEALSFGCSLVGTDHLLVGLLSSASTLEGAK